MVLCRPGDLPVTLHSGPVSSTLYGLKVILLKDGPGCLAVVSPGVGHLICPWLLAMVVASSLIWLSFWIPVHSGQVRPPEMRLAHCNFVQSMWHP